MRHRHACPRTILRLQIHDHTRREEESRASEHLHAESEEERPNHVVCVERTASETAGDVEDDEQDATVSGVVRPAEEAWVSKGGDLGVSVSMSYAGWGTGECRGDCLRLLR